MLECMTPPGAGHSLIWDQKHGMLLMGYIGMCSPKGYGFSAVLVIKGVSILADFGQLGHMVFAL